MAKMEEVQPSVRAIIKCLERAVYPRRADDVFDDFVTLAEIVLENLPYRLHAAATGQRWLDDRAEEAAKVAGRYDAEQMAALQEAFTLLVRMGEVERFRDVLGEIMMTWAIPNENTGEYFTPSDVALLCMELSMRDVEQRCYEHVAQAIDAGPLGELGFLNGKRVVEAGDQKTLLHALALSHEHLEPVAIYDCACGAGAMLLTAASKCPSWAVDTGVVQFYGQDIDERCVRMARIQCMVYAMNGFRQKVIAGAQGTLDVLLQANARREQYLAEKRRRQPATPALTLPAGQLALL